MPLSRRLPMAAFVLCAMLALSLPPAASRATDAQREPSREHRMELTAAFDGTAPRFGFTVDERRFDSVETLKAHLARLPRGSIVVWAPGCKRFGGEPLLSSQRDMEEFRAFLESHGIELNLIPSG
jgi:hypothetical protein